MTKKNDAPVEPEKPADKPKPVSVDEVSDTEKKAYELSQGGKK